MVMSTSGQNYLAGTGGRVSLIHVHVTCVICYNVNMVNV